MAFFAIYQVLILKVFNNKVLLQKCRDKEVKEFFGK